ncbi:MAG: hydroxyacid dehydrogenase [Nitriliruptorales bacterium]|nr:hydroxyacid dehydrogenase [Nitriliruptorales bacterium]
MGARRPVKAAVLPEGTRDWARVAVLDGGGQLVTLDEAEALVWTDAGGRGDSEARLTALLEEYDNIRWVQLPWAGVESYAEAGVFDHEHIWTCGKGVYAPPVAEHALSLALAGLRDLKRRSLAHAWGEQSGISLIDGRVTIFGGGGIAQELLRLLRPFGCAVSVVRRHAQPMDGVETVLDFAARYEALKGADVVFVALALTPETRGLIGEIEFELMEPHAWLVNVARGEHVVTEDLVIALRENAIGGAALDVTDPEPLPEGHPLWALPNCIVTPHTANTEDMAIPLLTARIEENVRRYAADQPLLGVVDPNLGY